MESYRKLQKTREAYRKQQKTSESYRKLQKATKNYGKLQKTTDSYRKLQKATANYRKHIENGQWSRPGFDNKGHVGKPKKNEKKPDRRIWLRT